MLWSYVLDPNLIYALLDPKSRESGGTDTIFSADFVNRTVHPSSERFTTVRSGNR